MPSEVCFEFLCDQCGEPLQVRDKPGVFYIDPCDSCLAEAREEGYEDGYEEGLAVGGSE